MNKVNPLIKLYEDINIKNQIAGTKIVRDFKLNFEHGEMVFYSFENLEYGSDLIFETDYYRIFPSDTDEKSVTVYNKSNEKYLELYSALYGKINGEKSRTKIINGKKLKMRFKMNKEKTKILTYCIEEGSNIANTNYTFDDIKHLFSGQYDIKFTFRLMSVMNHHYLMFQMTSMQYRLNPNYKAAMFGNENIQVVNGFTKTN